MGFLFALKKFPFLIIGEIVKYTGEQTLLQDVRKPGSEE